MNTVRNFIRSFPQQLARTGGVLAVAAVATLALPCAAHQWSDAQISITIEKDELRGRWTVALRDLEDTIGLDTNGDRAITWGEVRSRREHIVAHAREHLRLRADGHDMALSVEKLLIDDHHHDDDGDHPAGDASAPGAYLVLPFSAGLPAGGRRLEVHYDFLFALDPEHRGRLRVREAGRTLDAVFEPAQMQVAFTRPRGWFGGVAPGRAGTPAHLLAVGGTVALLVGLGWGIRRRRVGRA
jgi:hypothetical protein